MRKICGGKDERGINFLKSWEGGALKNLTGEIGGKIIGSYRFLKRRIWKINP